ncbi:hypothetical protein MM213_05980 [Belliella sp. R4-6]|uniref:Outer membrane protein beta-barrel domain-containing protein n=1 Tax=Belliella alkalica TaxID=1730871 RepID=A0ABS9V9C3_9BACT|nr:hypothetical protein [Belliella alkalica]MCH7413021.1 hypothetical protein [Belliella alkalica]
MKKLLILLLFSPIALFGQDIEVGVQGSFWWSNVGMSGVKAGSNGTLNIRQINSVYQYPYNQIGLYNFRTNIGSDFIYDNPGVRVFIRKNFPSYYIASGIQYHSEIFAVDIPYQSSNGSQIEQLFSNQSRLVEIPLTVGHRFYFAPYLRVFGGVQLTRAFTTAVHDRFFTVKYGPDIPIFEEPISELGSVLTNNFRDIYASALGGLGIDYMFITLDFQIERTVTSMTKSTLEFNGNPGVFDLRKTRKSIWIGFKIPLNYKSN